MMLVGSYFPNTENFGRLIVSYLAIAGGFLIGAFLSGLILQVLVRLAFASKVPPRILWLIRILGGVAFAWLVALFVFGSGGGPGWGFGGNGGGPGNGTGKESGNGQDTRPDSKDTRKGPGPGQVEETVQVTVLAFANGMRIEDGKFYRMGGERLSLKETTDLLERKQEDWAKSGKKFVNLEILIYDDSPDKDTYRVMDLQKWAKLHGVTPKLSLQKGNAP